MGSTRPKPDRSIRMLADRPVCLAIALCIISLVGCGKRHHILDPVIPVSPYEVPIAPESVMRNLAKAYSAKDSTAYKACFDDNYQGTSLDQQDPSPQLLNYTKADEAQHIAGLAKSPTVNTIQLLLVPAMVRSADVGDPVGWALIQNPIFSLRIYDGNDVWDLPATDETLEFHFIPTLDSSSPTDTTWKISKWVEVRQ